MDEWEESSMKRVPRGFCADSPAADLLRQRRWGVSATLPAEAAIAPGLVKQIARRFALAAPIVHFLNTPLAAARRANHPSRPRTAEDLLD
jgi:uncharacterized protein (DUF2461 family)